MEAKLFEVRDRGTFLSMMAVRLIVNETGDAGEAELFLLRRAGYNKTQVLESRSEPYIILVKLDGVEAQYDPFSWVGSARTIRYAHRHIIAEWEYLKTGEVIDIEYLLGETEVAKTSERFGEMERTIE